MNTSFITNTVSKKWAGKPIIPTPCPQNTHTHTHTHTHTLSILEERRGKIYLKCPCFMILVATTDFSFESDIFLFIGCDFEWRPRGLCQFWAGCKLLSTFIYLFFSLSRERQYSILKRNVVPQSNGYSFSTCFLYNIGNSLIFLELLFSFNCRGMITSF